MGPTLPHTQLVDRLAELVQRSGRFGLQSLGDDEVEALLPLYRAAASHLAELQTRGGDPQQAARTAEIVARAQALLYRGATRARESAWVRAARFLALEVPRTIRAEWRILAVAFALVYGFALVSYVAVANDLEVAYSLLDPSMVRSEIEQLEATKHGEPFRGNFTFGIDSSPQISGWIITHNIGVGVLFFATGLCPPLYLWIMAQNGLMLGTYTAVAAHWDQGFEISSILWCHGMLEIQALVLAGAAGLVLVRGCFAPGPWSRRHALKLASAIAWRLFVPVMPMLVCAGLIEGFVSPHASLAVRVSIAAVSLFAMLAWAYFGSRAAHGPRRMSSQPASTGSADSAGSASSTRTPAPAS